MPQPALYPSWFKTMIHLTTSVVSATVVVMLFISDMRDSTRTNTQDIKYIKESMSDIKLDMKDFKSDFKEDVKGISEDIEYVRKLIEERNSHD